jgi:hypothetical protein
MTWAKKLVQQAGNNSNEPTGKGWLMMAEIINESPFGQIKTRKLINQKIAKGEIEVFEGSSLNDFGRCVKRTWYRERK